MDRRNFLKAMLAACSAPAIVRADSLMQINPNWDSGLYVDVDIDRGNRIMTLEEITAEALRVLHKKEKLFNKINREYESPRSSGIIIPKDELRVRL